MYQVTTQPGSEPITTADMKEHLRVLHTDDDDYIESLIVAARIYLEKQYDIAINTQSITQYFDDWDVDKLKLTVAPIQSITTVKYYDSDDVQQTVDSSNYSVDIVSRYGRIQFKNGVTVPSVYDRPNAIEVEYVAGTDVTPPNVAHAMKLMVGDWYRDRERMPGNVKGRLLDTVERLMYVYK